MDIGSTSDLTLGYEAGERWLERASESERSELAAAFAGGGFRIYLTDDTFPSLISVLGLYRSLDSIEVDFSTSPWLSGFRDAVIEHLGGEPD